MEMTADGWTGTRVSVKPEWIDANRHMNVSAYDLVFDIAEKDFFAAFGVGDDYINRTEFSCFRLERLIRYERELLLDDPLEVRSRVAWTDYRKIHHFHELWNVRDGYRAAFADVVSVHVDLSLRKAATVELAEVRQPLEKFATEHAGLASPAGLLSRENGRRIGG
ncbi:thioesterase family protein [Aquamicrobium sp. LC103]|uniref:thioesterase family protein n=1 Tax=Aquamicrobium sp. LC103 TaxID=1120658 RepID=UPI00063E92EC|nr:thioesterase family protein [Aquamicrobium sp. LC103]